MEPKYDRAPYFSEGLASVKENGLYPPGAGTSCCMSGK
ncbi:WG repeat-containing protein [Sporomusa sp.]